LSGVAYEKQPPVFELPQAMVAARCDVNPIDCVSRLSSNRLNEGYDKVGVGVEMEMLRSQSRRPKEAQQGPNFVGMVVHVVQHATSALADMVWWKEDGDRSTARMRISAR
jgi:hypothetical protein